jgi:hypothetical protein
VLIRQIIKEFSIAMHEAARGLILDFIRPLQLPGSAALRFMVGCVSLHMWTDKSQVEYMGVLLHTVQLPKNGFQCLKNHQDSSVALTHPRNANLIRIQL